jgi:hypothetical protein
MTRGSRRQLRQMSDFELGWVVGLLEGEGCFSIDRPANRPNVYVRVEVQTADRDVLERLAEYTGLAGVYGPYKTRSKKHAPMFGWHVTGKIAVELMELVRNHMGGRRQRRIGEVLLAAGS